MPCFAFRDRLIDTDWRVIRPSHELPSAVLIDLETDFILRLVWRSFTFLFLRPWSFVCWCTRHVISPGSECYNLQLQVRNTWLHTICLFLLIAILRHHKHFWIYGLFQTEISGNLLCVLRCAFDKRPTTLLWTAQTVCSGFWDQARMASLVPLSMKIQFSFCGKFSRLHVLRTAVLRAQIVGC